MVLATRIVARMKHALIAVVLAAIASAAGAQTAPVRVGGNIPPPQKIKDVKPVYPPEAQQARATGVVIIEATIGEDGKVRDAVVKRSIPLLDQAALDAVRQWEYRPTLLNGVPVPVVMTVTVNFWLEGVPPPPMPMAGMIRLTSSRTQDGVTQVWEIPSERAASLPRWNPDDADPPLSRADVLRVARTSLAARYPQVQRFDLQSLTLSRVRRGAGVDFWYYQLAFFAYGAMPPGGPSVSVVVLPDGSLVEPQIQDGSAPAPPPGVYTIGQPGITPPRVLAPVSARYTEEARIRKISGVVGVQCIVGADGSVQSPRVVRSLDPQYGLDEEAVKAVRQFAFAPGTKDGQPVPVLINIEVSFSVR